jgi:dihydroflavonol-4-reductase
MTEAGGRLALVTGASGFVGGHLVDALVAEGWRARCLVRPRSDRGRLGAPGVEFVVGGLDDPASLSRAVAGVDVVFHLAAVTSAAREEEYDRVNHLGVVRVLEAMATVPAARIVLCSSLAVAGPAQPGRARTEADPPAPVGPYAISKVRAEEAVAASGVPHVIIRPPAVYGPGDRDILAAFRLASRGAAVRTGPPGQQLALVHARDLARGLVLAGQTAAATGVYYINGANHLWEEIVGAVGAAVARRPRVVPLPSIALWGAARASRLWARASGSKPLLTPERAFDLVQPAWICDDARARRDLGYRPQVTLADGMRETAAWYRAAGWL